MMGFFGTTINETITNEVATATNENNQGENWEHIMTICDKAGKNSDDAKAYLRAILRRLYSPDPHIGIQAVTLLDACIKNCGRTFHVEVASREFENDFTKLMSKAPPTVAARLRDSLKKWSDHEFRNDPQLNLIPSLYAKLKNSGYDFSTTDQTALKKTAALSKDPNVVESQEEENAIMQAIELSLKETKGVASTVPASTNLYPSTNLANTTANSSTNSVPKTPEIVKESFKVRALYDFEAAEDNELTFNAGEIIVVTDDSDPNWWKGSNQRGDGLFPSNFVTKDLNVEPEKPLEKSRSNKNVQFKDDSIVDDQIIGSKMGVPEIDESKIDRLLHLLHEADPTNPDKDSEEMLSLEREVDAMGPLIDAELERVDRKHAHLTQLSTDLVEALGMYHSLMREQPLPSPIAKMPPAYPYGPPQQPQYPGQLAMPQQPMVVPPTGLLPHERPPIPPFVPPHPHQFPIGYPEMGGAQMMTMGAPSNYPPFISLPNYIPQTMIQPNFPPTNLPTSQTMLENANQSNQNLQHYTMPTLNGTQPK